MNRFQIAFAAALLGAWLLLAPATAAAARPAPTTDQPRYDVSGGMYATMWATRMPTWKSGSATASRSRTGCVAIIQGDRRAACYDAVNQQMKWEYHATA